MASALPSFRQPPVNEVALSIQFAGLTAITAAHMGLFWARVRKKYPKISEHPPLDAAFEIFGASALRFTGQELKISTFLKPPVPRVWFEEADDGNELMQLQQDRIVHNWRRHSDSDVYPRYDHVRKRLREDLEQFLSFLDEEALGTLKPNQCEVTYINLITLDPTADAHREVSRIMSIANAWPEGKDLPVLENTLIQSRAVLHRDGEPTCRLYLEMQPVVHAVTGAPAIRLQLVARGKPNGEDIHDAFALLDFAHEGIVNTFAAVTTPAMHKVWGRTDV